VGGVIACNVLVGISFKVISYWVELSQVTS
jgi:hypothetical protein